jgi:hypothetical protein
MRSAFLCRLPRCSSDRAATCPVRHRRCYSGNHSILDSNIAVSDPGRTPSFAGHCLRTRSRFCGRRRHRVDSAFVGRAPHRFAMDCRTARCKPFLGDRHRSYPTAQGYDIRADAGSGRIASRRRYPRCIGHDDRGATWHPNPRDLGRLRFRAGLSGYCRYRPIVHAAYIWLLERVDPTLVATYTFVNPLIAVALGWFFLGEHPTTGMLVGAPLVVGAVGAAWLIDRTQETAKLK